MDPTNAFDIVYGVIGQKAAGKGEFGKRLAAKGFVTMTLSTPMRIIAERDVGPDYKVADLVYIGNVGRMLHGTGHWAGETLLLASQGGQRKVAIDGIRNPGEIDRLRELLGVRLVLVGIVAPFDLRFQRALKRQQSGDPLTLEGFRRMDQTDRGVGQPSDGQQVDLCLATVRPGNTYDNAGTFQEFHDWIDRTHAREEDTVNQLIFQRVADGLE